MEQNKSLTTNSTNNSEKSITINTINSNGVVQQTVQESVKPKSFSLDKSSLLIIILLFMFSSKLWDIAWDIGKSILYIIIILFLIGFVNQDLADDIKNIIHDFTNVNSNNNFITDIMAKFSGQLKSIMNIGQLNKGNVVQEVNPDDREKKFYTTTHTSLYDGTDNSSGGNTKNLANLDKSSSKNIFA